MATALTELRRTRRRRRLGDTEWFDLAYQVYLAGIFGGSAIIIASDFVGGVPVGEGAIADVLDRGPAVLGVLAIVALAVGLRSGSEGGPVSLEAADVQHVLLAPVPRGAVLRLPVIQRLRAVTAGAALAGGVGGLLASQRLPGTAPDWTMSGVVIGACVGALSVAMAVIAHAVRLRVWVATAIGAVLIGWQGAAVAGWTTGPADGLGSIGLWSMRRHVGDLVAVAVVLALIVAAIALAGRLRVEHLARRGDLVSQLRFAVTMQDLRTVVLLRRQLRQEQPRRRPWIRLPAGPGGAGTAAIRRGVHGLARVPAARVGRMAAMAAAGGAMAGVAALGTTAAIAGSGIALFVLGLDLVEPLSQEIDHPDLTERLPHAAGWLHERLLIGPLILAAPMAAIGATACTVVAPGSAAASFALALPITWAGMTGAIVNVVRDESDGSSSETSFAPPEFAGFKNLIRTALPVAMSTLATLAVLAVRELPTAGVVVRCLVGIGLYLAGVRWWLVRRADLKSRWRQFAAGATA